MFAGDVTDTIQIGSGEVVIRKLSGRSLEKAELARQIEVSGLTRSFSSDVVESIASKKKDKVVKKLSELSPAELEELDLKRHTTYDRSFVLLAGIKSWSSDKKVNQESVDDLDEETSELLFHKILKLSLPLIDEKEAEKLQKNS